MSIFRGLGLIFGKYLKEDKDNQDLLQIPLCIKFKDCQKNHDWGFAVHLVCGDTCAPKQSINAGA